MSESLKKVVIGSMVVASLVGLAAVGDLVLGFPFGGTEHTRTPDIIFILCAGILGYLAYDAYKDLR